MASLSPRWLFSELRRRRMFHTLALYIVGAWVALQVAELALPALDLPEQAIRYVWLGAILIFPLVLVSAPSMRKVAVYGFAALIVMLGIFTMRYNVVMGGEFIPLL